MRSLPFWDVTQFRLVVTDIAGQFISPIFSGQAVCWFMHFMFVCFEISLDIVRISWISVSIAAELCAMYVMSASYCKILGPGGLTYINRTAVKNSHLIQDKEL